MNTTREGFRIAHDVSVYSLIAVARAAAPLMTEGGSIVTMTYYGAEKVVPKYNVMGVAKAALEASVRYLANDLGPRRHSRECDFRGADQDAGGARNFGAGRNVEVACGARAVETQCGSGRSGQHGGVFIVGRGIGNYRRDDLRGLRIQHHGFLSWDLS